jgi:hypothetical protein
LPQRKFENHGGAASCQTTFGERPWQARHK